MNDAMLDPDQLAHLEDQRDFLLASLADLEREHDAGDLDDADYAELRDDYTARAAETLRAIDEHRTAFEAARRPRSLGRTLAILGGVGVFAVIAGFVVAASVGARKPGDTMTGGIQTKQTATQRANACISKMARPGGDADPAITCFRTVLKEDKRNVVALAWLGWQISLITPSQDASLRPQLQAAAQGFVDRAVEVDGGYSYARAFRAIIAYRNGDAAKAKQYLQDFEDHDPSADAQAIIEQFDLKTNIALLEKVQDGTVTTTAPATTTTTTPSSTTRPG